MSEIKKPAPDSHFRLLKCRSCGSENVGYQEWPGKLYRVKCQGCGQRTPAYQCRHDAQLDWNGRFGSQ